MKMFRNYPQQSFKLRSPNDSLMVMGLALMLLGVVAFFMQEDGILLGVGTFVRIFIIFWVPKAAELVNRNKIIWTIVGLVSPSLAFIILGSIGYKNSPEAHQIVDECTSKLHEEFERLQKARELGEITQEQVNFEINEYVEELQEYAKENLTIKYEKSSSNLLNKQLEKKGYILDENSDALVEFTGRCPGCNTKVDEDAEFCPECGLKLK